MSTLLPVQPAPPQRRSDTVTPALGESRTDAGRGAFADSLATARSDTNRTSQDANSEPPETRTQRAAIEQRAQVQALMLNGAMRFAVARGDEQAPPSLTPIVSSLPAAAPSAAASDDEEISGSLATLVPIASPPKALVPAEAVLPDDAIAAALPEVPATEPDAYTTARAAAAALAAMLLVASLPDPAPRVPATDVPNDDVNDGVNDGVSDDMNVDRHVDRHVDVRDTSAARGSAGIVQRLATDDARGSALVEDHFDVPASQSGAIVRDATMPPVSDTWPKSLNETVPMIRESTMNPANATRVLNVATVSAPAELARTDATIGTDGNSHGDSHNAERAGLTRAPAASRESAAAPSVPVRGRGDVTRVETDVAALSPEFRERLAKVIERMRSEYGHAVTVVETARTQERQNALYAQGRTTAGPVVTWTRNSRHTKGLAADLMVDGGWQNPVGYAHLATVAKQEGLRTLGARDPGHVELPGQSAVSGETLGALLGDLEGEAGDAARQVHAELRTRSDAAARASTMAEVANVAQVARVATVAQVARVASVARPGNGPREASGGEPAAAQSASPLALSVPSSSIAGSDAGSAPRLVTPTAAVNMADRISHLMDLQATQSARPLNSVLLRMDNVNGMEDQIRIDTRGTMVDARLGLANAQQAAAATDRLGELRAALERRGLSADGVQVQAASAVRATDTATFSRAAAPSLELAAMRAAAESQAHGGMRDQGGRDQQQREAFARDQARNTPRSSSDDARHRSRREQPEERR